MLERWFGPKVHHYLHIVGMMVLAFGLPFNKVLMSIGSIWGLSNLLLEGKFRSYFNRIKSNKALLFVLALFGIHLLALLWTENFAYAFHDLRIKLPLFAVPLALVAHPITKRKEIHLILLTFLTSLTIISIVNGINYSQMTTVEISQNFREISVFGSHIRFSILIVIGIVIAGYFIFILKNWRVLFAVLVIWFAYYTYFSQVLSAPLSIISVFIFAFLYWVWPKKILRYSLVSICLLAFGVAVVSVQTVKQKPPIHFSQLDEFSPYGNLYFHDSLHPSFENGKPVYIYISWDEIELDWHKYFSIPFNNKDKEGNPIETTFYRYMTALDLRKDRDGMKKLSQTDIENIENGIATPLLLEKGLSGRLASLKYAIENQIDPNNSTILQRIEYWKTADQIILQNPLFGVGTGDVQNAFEKQYLINKTKLHLENQLRAHNMFLTLQVTFGVMGTLILLFLIGHYLQFNRSVNNLLAFCVFGAIIASFLVEDTLETQTGVTLFSFFIGLFLVKWEGERLDTDP
jgi:hypothetical protein